MSPGQNGHEKLICVPIGAPSRRSRHGRGQAAPERAGNEEGSMIRSLSAADFAPWKELWLAYLRFYRAEVSDEATAVTFRRLCNQTDGMIGLVATDDHGGLVGLAHLVFHSSTWSADPSCYLEDLFVAPAARGGGTARQLLEAAFAEAGRRGAARTYWETQEFNAPARSLYDQVAHRTSFVVYER
jgi:GNAT superfamily N-acetyltransferase